MASIPDHTLPFNALDDYNDFNDPERLSSLNYDPLFSSWSKGDKFSRRNFGWKPNLEVGNVTRCK